ncbi:hypothetical protein PYCCODRAFT_1469622 [Trametes coccinea BRFM310]|uniref:BAH domain-containing protein n=1 Tax=Trametes coccinea (strain BRFM310) TaxID=1353009 RepID=A0A1Y2IFW0_TRAC3|nr:hypothetical protein PYCCODRAFT_1469622 [Trametes coccinea BRFM310]
MAIVIPRNFAEWARVFADADPVEEIIAHGHPPRGRLLVQQAQFVTIMPNGTRREDVNLAEQQHIAVVSALANSEHIGPLVKLQWIYRRDELNRNRCPDRFTSDFIVNGGKKEVFITQHETVTSGDAIYDVIPVVSFNPNTISLPVLDSASCYYRDGFTFVRVLNTHYYRLPQQHFRNARSGSTPTAWFKP